LSNLAWRQGPCEHGAGALSPALSPYLRDRVLLPLTLLSSGAMACFWSSDGDLGFHLATGREILATGRIPATNVLSYTQPLHEWRLHQWLPGVLFELLWRSYGITGVIGAKMLVVAATFGVVYAAARRFGAGPLPSSLACLLAAAASAFRFEARPYLFTHLTLALTMLCVAIYFDASAQRQPARAWRALAAAALVASIACHVHAGALDSLIVMLCVALGCALEPVRAKWLGARVLEPSGLEPAGRFLLAVLVAGLLAALTLAAYHPIGPRILAFPFEMGSDLYLAEHLVEFRPPWRIPVGMLLAYWLFLGLALALAASRLRVLHAALLLALFAYALLSLRFVRMVYAFGVVASPIVALSLQGLSLPSSLRPRPLLSALSIIALCFAAPLYAYRTETPGFGFSPLVWPLGHFRFIREHALRGPAYVSDAWGGPFLGMFYPERKAFFDGRLEAYSPQFVRGVYQRIRYGEPGWDALLDRYGVEIVLLRYTARGEAGFQHGRPNLRQLLARDPRYTLVRFDDQGELFVRTQGKNAALAQQLGLCCIDPDRRVFTQPGAGAAPGLLRALELGDRSATLLGMTALAVARAGAHELADKLAAEALRVAPGDPWVARVKARIAGHEKHPSGAGSP
jgi:hypothetical protein